MNFQKLYRKIQSIDNPSRTISESVSPDDIKDLVSQLEIGDITYEEFREKLDSLESTDYSMRQGEQGEPDRREADAWEKERGDWEGMDDEIDDEEFGLDEECGIGGPSNSPQQQTDNVTMNVSMNGSGAGGIRDLMNVLKDIQDGPDDKDSTDAGSTVLLKQPSVSALFGKENAMNSPDEQYMDIDSVINPPSNGINSPTKSYPVAAGGDNPMALKPRLESLYQQIKNR